MITPSISIVGDRLRIEIPIEVICIEARRKRDVIDADRLKLTFRQRQVLAVLLTGKSHKEIACGLGISLSCVKNHLNAIYAKVGMHREELLIRYGKAA